VASVVAALVSDVGCQRETNEDCGRIVQPCDPGLLARKGVLVAVADGMGGHKGGAVASRLAVEIVGRVYYASPASPGIALEEALREANQELFELSQGDETLRGLGSTCTALAIQGGAAYSAHVGDSRLYLIRGGEVRRMTEDHSVVAEMVKKGLLTEEEARRHADRNVILRALGASPQVELSAPTAPLPVRTGDRFVICSDGLHDLVTDREIGQVVMSQDPAGACELLVATARERGGHDNITVAVVSV
jgi:protein phosphatase